MSDKTEVVFSELLRMRLENMGMLRSCLNCENFDLYGERCVLADATPPPSIAARGCEAWSLDIPF